MKNPLLILFLLFLSSCSLFKNSKLHKSNKRIIIIGAGVSGLSAASYLSKKGYKPIILEAQPNIGGRVSTDRSLGIPFDQGGSWIHGTRRNPISKLAKKSEMETFVTDDESIKVYDTDGSEYPASTLEQAEKKYDKILWNFEGEKDKSFEEIFYQDYPEYQAQRIWDYMLSAFLEFDTGGDISKLSSTSFYDDKAFRGKDAISTEGYDKIVSYLADGLDIRLNNIVTAVDYSQDSISILTNRDKYVADAVLVTVPLGVLKKGNIEFAPSLPASIQSAINQLEMGTVNKFLLVWDESFWEESLHYIGYTSSQKGKFNLFMNMKAFTGANALMTFTFGEYSKTAEKLSDQKVKDEIMNHLKAIYGDSIPYPTNILRTKWNQNPFTYGSYSFLPKGVESKAFTVFETPVDNKVFFAGEHTIKNYRGTVHGAYLSGIREYQEND